MRIGGPGEIVDVFLIISVGGFSLRRVFSGVLQNAGGGDDKTGGNGDVDLILSEIRVEFAGGVVLVAVPLAPLGVTLAGFFIDSDLREPLGDEEEILMITGPGKHARQL